MKEDLDKNKEFTLAILENRLLKIDQDIEKIRKYILWGRIMSTIQVILILIPIILGFLLLPSLISEVGGLQQSGQSLQNLQKLLQQYQQIPLKK